MVGVVSAAVAPIWLPFALTYGVISASLTLLALLAHWRAPLFRAFWARPINKFWVVWMILIVCSGGMVGARRAARAARRARRCAARLTRFLPFPPAPRRSR